MWSSAGRPGVERSPTARAEERLAAAGDPGGQGRGGRGAIGIGRAPSSDWDRAQTLYKNDDISTAQYDQFRNRWESAEARAEAGEGARRRWCRPVRARKQIEARRRRRWSGARGALKMAEANALEVKRREQELATRRAEIARSRAQPRPDRFAACRYRRASRRWTAWCW